VPSLALSNFVSKLFTHHVSSLINVPPKRQFLAGNSPLSNLPSGVYPLDGFLYMLLYVIGQMILFERNTVPAVIRHG